ncbi:hypothetical protein Cpir12675_004630 [Ceratocystis pirilliformis]|uniref:Uncharacterized protein n=1 Tax=Ceratocystis pirilliformis TaxID=259994 RepID=A0ABR3YWA3_9PEZI
MYVALTKPARQACLQCFGSRQTLYSVSRQARNFQALRLLRQEDKPGNPASHDPPKSSDTSAALDHDRIHASSPAAPDTKGLSSQQPPASSEENFKSFENIFSDISRQKSLKATAQNAETWAIEDFGFGSGEDVFGKSQRRNPSSHKKGSKGQGGHSSRDKPRSYDNKSNTRWTETRYNSRARNTTEAANRDELVSTMPQGRAIPENETEHQTSSQQNRNEWLDDDALVNVHAGREGHYPYSHSGRSRDSRYERDYGPGEFQLSPRQFRPRELKEKLKPRRRKPQEDEVLEKMSTEGLMFDMDGAMLEEALNTDKDTEKENDEAIAETEGQTGKVTDITEPLETTEATEAQTTEIQPPPSQNAPNSTHLPAIVPSNPADPTDPIKALESIPRQIQIENATTKNKRFRTRTQRVQISSEALDKPILGQPGQAIIMRTSRLPKNLDYETQVFESDSLDAGEIEAIARDRVVPTDQELVANIDELRPSSNIIQYEEFLRLQAMLDSSLTAENLQSYLDHYNTPRVLNPGTDFRDPEDIDYDWISGPVTWIPKALIKTEDFKRKNILILNLMLREWKLKIQEEEFGRGSMTVKIASQAVGLLLSPQTNMLSLLKKRYLGLGEDIRVNPLDNTFVVNASHALSLTLLRKINELASRMRGGSIPLALFDNRRLSDAEVRELAGITTAWIHQSPEGEKNPTVEVGWIEDVMPMPTIESIKHVVTRLMHVALMPAVESTALAIILPFGTATSEYAMLVQDHSNPKKRNWKNRMGEWMRLTTPAIEKPKTTEPESVDTIDTKKATQSAKTTVSKLALPVELQNALKWPLSTSEPRATSAPSAWSPITTRTSAVFGHMLHVKPTTATTSCVPCPAGPPTLSTSFLVPTIPHISCLARIPIDPATLPTESHTLVLHFVASPQSLPTAISASVAPKLELHISVPESASSITWLNSAKRLVYVRAAHRTQVLLPAADVDVQITQQRVQTLATDALVNNANLQTFIDESILDLVEGTLRTPPAVNLSVPLGDLETGSEVEAMSPELQFLFTGLEMRESFTAPFHGHRLAHSSIEAGYHGGQRAEFSLEPVIPTTTTSPNSLRINVSEPTNTLEDEIALAGSPDASTTDPSHAEDNYLCSVYAIATGHYFPWHQKLERFRC